VSGPPQAAARAAGNAMSQLVGGSFRGTPSPGLPSLFPCPPGFVQIGASWSALSATPSALTLKAREGKEKIEWF